MRCTAFATMVLLTLAALPAAAQRPDSPISRRPVTRSPHPLLRAFDADRDGKLSSSEIESAAERLSAADADADGEVSGTEILRHAPFGPPTVRAAGPRIVFREPRKIENAPLGKSDDENRVLAALERMARGPRYANVSSSDGRFLRQLTEAIGAKRVVEIGTSTGYSGVWFALALRSTGGKLYTHEIDPGRIAIAEENFKQAGVDELITIIPGNAHETVKQHKEPIDILFLDADKAGYIDYLEKLLPLVRPGGLILAHNMRFPQPDPRYIEAVTKNPDLDTSFLLMDGAGIGMTVKKR
jgi:caffeoyl-CoA O-methyltransferase